MMAYEHGSLTIIEIAKSGQQTTENQGKCMNTKENTNKDGEIRFWKAMAIIELMMLIGIAITLGITLKLAQ